MFSIPAGDGTNQTRLEGFLTNCGCMGPVASTVGCRDEVSNDDTLGNHLTKLCYFDIIVITFPLYFIFRFPTHFIPNVLDFGFPTRRGPVSLCLIVCMHSVGEEAELGYQLQLRRNRVCMITI